MSLEALPWERLSEDSTIQVRQLSQGRIEVMPRADGQGWMWWVNCGRGNQAQGTESGQSRAKGRAMLVYLAMTREVVT